MIGADKAGLETLTAKINSEWGEKTVQSMNLTLEFRNSH